MLLGDTRHDALTGQAVAYEHDATVVGPRDTPAAGRDRASLELELCTDAHESVAITFESPSTRTGPTVDSGHVRASNHASPARALEATRTAFWSSHAATVHLALITTRCSPVATIGHASPYAHV